MSNAKKQGNWAYMLSDDRTLLFPDLGRRGRHTASTSPSSLRNRTASNASSTSTGTSSPLAGPSSSTAPQIPQSILSTATLDAAPKSAPLAPATRPPWQGTFLEADDPPQPQHSVPPLRRRSEQLLSSNLRDSFISIVDDPFFQQYHSPREWLGEDGGSSDADPTAPAPPNAAAPSSAGHEPLSHSHPTVAAAAAAATATATATAAASAVHKGSPLRRDSAIVSSPPPPAMEAVNIAVIGADGVGKSAFIQRALRLTRTPNTSITAIRLDVESVPHVVALIELDLEYFDVNPNQKIHWPKQINGHMVPRIDGALILYDVMNRDSIRDLPHALSALALSGLPTMLVATKCDNPDSSRQIDVAGMTAAFPSVLADFQTSVNVPASTRECLQAIVLASVFSRKDKEPSTRRRAASSAAHLDTHSDNSRSRPLNDRSNNKHNRASSDLSLLRGALPGATDRDSYYRTQNSRSPRIEYPNTPQIAAGAFGNDMGDEDSQTVQGMLRSPGVRLDAGSSFLDVDESDGESLRYSEDNPAMHRHEAANTDKPFRTGVQFEDLVDRLLAQPMSRADSNFSDIFLCLYRKFASPRELFSGILKHFNDTWNDKTCHYLERTATQFRIIEVVARWVSMYPGDFARPSTRRQLDAFVSHLTDEPIFAVASQQLRDHLELDVVEDDDTEWAHCDEASDDEVEPDHSGGAGDTTPTGGPQRGPDSLPSDSLQSLQLNDSHSSDRLRNTPSESGSRSTTLSQFQFHSYEDYEREAATMMPTAMLPLNKFRYHIFMNFKPEDMADEITRIDWIMFSSIRIRDLVRHVSLSLQEKERCKSLANVNRMISHFNHVAKWVANMILIRDKAKHRAPCLQKFMEIALCLRKLNNYNGLAAVLAGINGTAIHRLAQTRLLVDADIQKRFARLVLLMSTQKSHFAYRLAWENSSLPRIPFIPLHRRDLVSAEEGSRTFLGPLGDRVNWKKFEVLGEVLLPIMRSQGTPYPNLKRNQQAREVILDCRMPSDDEEIYQRSVQVEPNTGSTAAESIKKKFPWLPK